MKLFNRSLKLLSIAFFAGVLFSSCGGDDTPAVTLQIETKEELIAFCELINDEEDYNAILMNDINLAGEDWTPIGNSSSNPFCGTFDGNGYTISNLTISSVNATFRGLFGHINGGTITNLTLENPQISTGGSYAGALSGRIYNNSSISSCHVVGGSITGTSYVGGLTGYYYTYSSSSKLKDCSNTADVSGEDYVGGVVGYFLSYDETKCYMRECYNAGNVSGTEGYIGGVVGRFASSTSSTYLTLTNCYNTGSVTGDCNYVGGVAGSSNFASVIGCYNTGDIVGLERTGGVIGYSSYNPTACYNTGDVSGTNRVGGVVGSLNTSEITGCYSTGTITGTSSVGGVAGYAISTTVNGNYFVNQSGDDATYGIGSSESNEGASSLAATSDLNTSTVVDAMNSAITSYSKSISNKYSVGTTLPILSE